MQIFYNKVQSLFVVPEDDIAQVKYRIEEGTGLPAGVQRLIYSGKELHEGQTVMGSGLEAGSTMHLVLRLRGGKGGFGSLLRSAGRAALTDNFDACRDLSGRRMRHVNADKKLTEWAAQARERELEKVAAKHIRDEERAAQQAAEQQVDMDDVKIAQDAALANVMSAVESALASAPAKRRSDPALLPAKRQKGPCHMTHLDGNLSSDSDEEPDQEADIGPADTTIMSASKHEGHAVGNQQDSVATADMHSGSGSSGSEQEALDNSLHPGHAPQEDMRSLEGSAAPGTEAMSVSAKASSLETAGHSTDITALASTAAPDTPPASAGPAVDSQPASAPEKANWEPVDLSSYKSAEELETLGLDHLKAELQRRGWKAGGTLSERAARLFLLSRTPPEKIDRKHIAKPAKK